MEQGALIRKHSFDTVLLCCLICISFFAANTTYSDYIMGPDPYPNHRWVAETSIYQSGLIYAHSKTSLNTHFHEYDKARVNATLTYLDGTQETQSICADPSALVGWNFSVLPGRYEIQADHYVGTGSCTGTHVAHTSCIWDTTQVSIDYFYATPQSIPASGTATLYWGTTNGTSFNINGTSVPATGSMVVSPTSSTIYTLTASNPYTSTQAKTSVRTNEPLTPHFYNYSVRHEKGVSPFFPYMQVEQESVNSANGNLHSAVPLLSRPGRNGLGVNLTLAYNSKIWDFFVQGSTLYATLPEYDSWVGLGWTLTIGRIIDDSANGKYYVTSSDGSNHVLKYYGGAWRSTDSTYMIYDPNTRKLTLKGGTKLWFNYQDVVRPYMRYATMISDTNGNYLDIAYSGTGGRISAISDTLGNTYNFLLDSSGRLQYIRYWNTNDTTQATGTISLDYQSLAPAFGSGATTDPMLTPQPTLYHVTYLTGVRYGFSYNSSGLLEQVAYPAIGAPSRYFYTKYTVLDRLLNRTVPDYYVTSHDTGAGTATWTWSTNPSGNAAPTTVGISIPERVGTTHYMQKSSTGWADGLVTRTKKADSLTLQASQDWIQDDEQLTAIYNPRVAFTKKTTKLTYTPYTTKFVRTEFSYADFTDYSGNVKEIREYAFDDGALRRKTVIGYLHESNGSYVALNILDRVSSTLVYDESNNLVSKATTAYDGAALYSAPNAIRHGPAYGTGYLTRGLPTSVSRWYNIAQNLYVTAASRYDECGNPREITDPQSNMTYSEYWLSASDNAYAFPLITVNAGGHVTETTYNYKSGVPLTTEDSNGKVTTMTYDNYDRVTQITRQGDGWRKTFTYVESPSYAFSPYALVRQYLTEAAYVEQRMDLDNMGRPKESTVLGNIKQDQTYDNASVVKTRSLPHISGQRAYNVTYQDGIGYQYVFYPDGRRINYYNGLDSTRIQRNDGAQRTYYYQEDGKIKNVLEQDPATGELNVGTDYYYDALGRLTTISQGVQTRTYTYDDMGRLLTETLPESGTTSYIYDDNSNVFSRTDARGIVTVYDYDELNRITTKSYSDGTPTVNYFYDSLRCSPLSRQKMILNKVENLP